MPVRQVTCASSVCITRLPRWDGKGRRSGAHGLLVTSRGGGGAPASCASGAGPCRDRPGGQLAWAPSRGMQCFNVGVLPSSGPRETGLKRGGGGEGTYQQQQQQRSSAARSLTSPALVANAAPNLRYYHNSSCLDILLSLSYSLHLLKTRMLGRARPGGRDPRRLMSGSARRPKIMP